MSQNLLSCPLDGICTCCGILYWVFVLPLLWDKVLKMKLKLKLKIGIEIEIEIEIETWNWNWNRNWNWNWNSYTESFSWSDLIVVMLLELMCPCVNSNGYIWSCFRISGWSLWSKECHEGFCFPCLMKGFSW